MCIDCVYLCVCDVRVSMQSLHPPPPQQGADQGHNASRGALVCLRYVCRQLGVRVIGGQSGSTIFKARVFEFIDV